MPARTLAVVAAASLALTGVALLPSPDAAPRSVAHAAASADTPFTIDTVHSAVIFRVKHMNVSHFFGRFNRIAGAFHLNREAPEKSVLNITVEAGSVDTANSNRDEHLRGPDFFSVAEFPTLTFRGTSFRKVNDTTFEVTGPLTLRGQTREITVTVTDTGSGPGRRGGTIAGIESTFSFNRSDFGMTYMLQGLSDQISITAGIQGGRQ